MSSSSSSLDLATRRIAAIGRHVSAGAGGVSREPTRGAASASRVAGSKAGVKRDDDVVVVASVRTAMTKSRRGGFKDTTPDDLLVAVMSEAIKRSTLSPADIEDVTVGNVGQPGAGAAMARMAQLRAGMPKETPLSCVNRQCSSGLQAVMNVVGAIRAGFIDCGMACGVETMTINDMAKAPMPDVNWGRLDEGPDAMKCTVSMGQSSENVAAKYGISRERQDAFAAESQRRALEAQKTGAFDAEIVPVKTVWTDPKTEEEKEVTIDKDDGVRPGTTVEKLGKLRAAFAADGSTTAGNASQTSDGAAAVILMTRAMAKAKGLPIKGVVRGFHVTGVAPEIMGIGPAAAVPPALEASGLTVADIDAVELNEAFASQALYCCDALGLDPAKVNPLGGAIAIGHPLGCTGARQVATLLHHLERTNGKYGIVTMCIGTGMGAACVFEREV